ncbi:MAG: hypothetical protein J6X44_02345 [Thermoguttaceae bacterium]|nr:hypothetical protein [Thermoguttaceae bacterium]
MKCIRFKRSKKGVFPAFILFSLFLNVCSNAQDEEIPLYLESSDEALINVDPESTYVSSADQGQPTTFSDSLITPDEAYRQLVAGNARYLKEDSNEAKELPKFSFKESKYPIATILYSLDMPILPTTLTQTTDHDVYLSGVKAGAVSSDDLAAIEYGLLNLQTPLLVVVGHYPSRDVSNLIRKYDALEKRAQAEAAKITSSGVRTLPKGTTSEEMKLYNLVGPAIARSKEAYPDLQGYELANIVSEALVWQSLETILMKSTVTQNLVRAGKLNLIAAIADDSTGKIYWLGEHPLQEEFLTPTPENLRNIAEQNEILTDSDLSTPLSDAQIQEYVTLYESNTYYNDVINAYYIQPEYYVPSWELFSARAWSYRPWYGVWVEPFTPWPYWQPWGYPPETPGLDVSIWDGRLNFFIGYNRYSGPYRSWDPHFRPRSSWWNVEIFLNPSGHWRDPVFDLVWRGLHNDIRHVPFDQRPLHHPAGPRPGDNPRPAPVRPAPQPGGPAGSPLKPGDVPGRYRPGAARPGIVPRLDNWGIGPKPNNQGVGGGFFRPGNQPIPSNRGNVAPGRPEPNPSSTNPDVNAGPGKPGKPDAGSRPTAPDPNEGANKPTSPDAGPKPAGSDQNRGTNRPTRPNAGSRQEGPRANGGDNRPESPNVGSRPAEPNPNDGVGRTGRPGASSGLIRPNAGAGVARPGSSGVNQGSANSGTDVGSNTSGSQPGSARPARQGVTPITGRPTARVPESLGTALESASPAANVRTISPNSSENNQNSLTSPMRRQGRFGDSFEFSRGMRSGSVTTPELRSATRPTSPSANNGNQRTVQPGTSILSARTSPQESLTSNRPSPSGLRNVETNRIANGTSAFPPRSEISTRPIPSDSNLTSRPTSRSALRPSTPSGANTMRSPDFSRNANPRPTSLSGSSNSPRPDVFKGSPGLNRPSGPMPTP